MPLTPLDIQNKEFRRALRGYSQSEVDEFLDQVVREFEDLLNDNASLRDRVETLQAKVEQYERLENTLHNTLVVAQQAADEVKSSARKEADLALEEARGRAEEIVREARERAAELRRALDDLVRRGRVYHAQMRGMLTSQLDLLEAERRRLEEAARETAAAAADEQDDDEQAAAVHSSQATSGAEEGEGPPDGTRDASTQS